MRILDIGSGSGDVALTAAKMVGSTGEVIGVDVNGEILETAKHRAKKTGLTNISFIEGDARTLEWEDNFDAIIGRLVLMYMAKPTETLKELKSYLKPGGIIAFQELDLTLFQSLTHPKTPIMNQLMQWICEVFQRSGAHIGMGLELYRTFIDAELPEPKLDFAAPMGGDQLWSGYQYIANSFRSVLPLLEEYNIASAIEVDVETLADRLRKEMMTAKRPIVLTPHVTAWTKLPSL